MTKKTDTTHVLTATEKIAEQLDTFIIANTKAITMYTDTDAQGNPIKITSFDQILIDRPKLVQDVANWISQREHDIAMNHHRNGLYAGRKEAGAMFLSALDAEVRKFTEAPLIDVKDVSMIAKRAVAAISKSTEETK